VLLQTVGNKKNIEDNQKNDQSDWDG